MIVVSWNVRDSLRQCLASILASRGIQPRVVVIDNGSADGSVEMVRAEFPDVRLIKNQTNRGFAAAVNQGLAQHSSGHVALINCDLKLEPETIRTLLDWFQRLPQVGIAGPMLRYEDESLQPSVKRFPRWQDLALVLSKLPNLIPGIAQRYQAADFNYSKTQVVDQVMGSCFLIRDELLKVLPRFDEQYFIWFEEVDYCLTAKALGWQTLYVAEAQAIHGRGQSFQQHPVTTKQRFLRQSIRYYVRKHFGRMAEMSLMPFLLMSWVSAGVIQAAHLRKPQMAKEF